MIEGIHHGFRPDDEIDFSGVFVECGDGLRGVEGEALLNGCAFFAGIALGVVGLDDGDDGAGRERFWGLRHPVEAVGEDGDDDSCCHARGSDGSWDF